MDETAEGGGMNIYFTAGVAYIMFWVGICVESVGHTPTNLEPYHWTLPFFMAGAMGFPFVVGYFAGKEE